MAPRSTRGWLYWAARRLGDVQAARRGPTSYAKRVVRRQGYRDVNKALGRIYRKGGLG
jgi:hypothetical protein